MVPKETSGEKHDYRMRDLRLVHRSSIGCQFDPDAEYQKDRGLAQFDGLDAYVGPDGLMLLLSKLHTRGPVEMVVEMIRRLHVPGYEHARHHLARAIAEGVITRRDRGYYTQADIEAAIAFAKNP
ncbi:hypothetical protein [Polyangium jinanense]|uniref:Uncharacterized protein n=1 Tax=Polyangium jinanense TaxID=2829994 RepID=A0A9X4AV06_9BACT|nr:hypothetical protein [Polyangium jinanense]MDC3985793.1 hypothetical protein [Polyangium jinanense]